MAGYTGGQSRADRGSLVYRTYYVPTLRTHLMRHCTIAPECQEETELATHPRHVPPGSKKASIQLTLTDMLGRLGSLHWRKQKHTVTSKVTGLLGIPTRVSGWSPSSYHTHCPMNWWSTISSQMRPFLSSLVLVGWSPPSWECL